VLVVLVRLSYILPPLAWMGFIYFLSDQPASGYARFKGALDFLPWRQELVHVALYFVLTLLIARLAAMAFLGRGAADLYKLAAIAVLFSVLYGIMDEIHQRYVPGRNPSLVGIIADTLGAIVAASLWVTWARWRGSPRHRPGPGPGG
jgi:VanZ family protein